MKKIYITSDGFVGEYLKKYFKENLTENIDSADVVINTIGILKEGKYTYEDSHIKKVKELIPKVKNKKLIHISALGSKTIHPSRYHQTKALGEKIIKKNLQNYVILKPSLILGEGQKLYKDLEKFKNFPIIFVPKMRVAPVEIEKLAAFIKRIIKDDLKGEFEVCGEEIVPMKKIFKEAFKKFNKNPIIIEMPKWYFGLMLPILSKLNILSKDEYLMIEDNICKEI
jgi:NADH dehydrogenase